MTRHPLRTARRIVAATVAAMFLGAALLILIATLRARPQDLPWTPLDLGEPVGLFTGRKLTALARDVPQCRALLDRAGVRYTALPPRREGRCGYDDAVRLAAGGARRIAVAPATPGVACPVAAALSVWEWQIVQPAAERSFGTGVARIDHFGSYACRRMYGRDTGAISEHSTANALDVAGFVLADGRRITVARDWRGEDREARFLHEVRDGACGVFATVLSPDYNQAHRDHLHLDQADRGAAGWRACR